MLQFKLRENDRKMQKKLIFLFSASLAALLIGLVQAEEVELTSLSGEAEIMLSGESSYATAEEGMKLEAGDSIRTPSGSSVELSFNDDNTNLVRLSENTQAHILLENEEKIYMASGEIFSSVSNLRGGSFEIRTPTAVSGARGTDWVTSVTSEGTEIEAIDSQPYVRHMESNGSFSRQITVINPGQMTTVQKFKPPATPRQIPQARREKWQVLKQDVRKRGVDAVQKRQQRPVFNRQKFLERKTGGAQPGGYQGGPGGQEKRPLRSGQGFDQDKPGPQAEARKLGDPYKNKSQGRPGESGIQPGTPGQFPEKRLGVPYSNQGQGPDKKIGHPQGKPGQLQDKKFTPAQGNRGPHKQPQGKMGLPDGNKGAGASKGSGPRPGVKR
jgi:hypothetical protein